ncbi:polymorphic toxin type 44 domain-containing protein, partial [Streptomyces sp. NPDC050388]|uniref:polymorphic toxin type 44 domain-containing protein n=1 Tax=Streptomyces sp. NPDC050388 TaxID=3155781 RepID=UPI003426CE72
GLRPDGMCGGSSSSCNGGTETFTKTATGWDWSYTTTSTVSVNPGGSGGSGGSGGFSGFSGVLTITVRNNGGKASRKTTFKKGPEPKPDLKMGEDLFSEMASYMYDELTYNARSNEVRTIQGLLRPWAWYDGLAGRSQGRDRAAALAVWTAKVCPKICEWDHKPKLDKKFNLSKKGYFIDVPGTDYKVFYDMWSNVHYGYVGRAAGLDSKTLIEGASVADPVLVGQDDLGDQVTMQAGVDLFDKHGLNLTREQFHAAVIDTIGQMYTKGVDQVKKK